MSAWIEYNIVCERAFCKKCENAHIKLGFALT